MGEARFEAAGLSLRRAGAKDLGRVVTLQQAAYAKNRALLGVEPIPLLADYDRIVAEHEVWLAEEGQRLEGVLILQARPDDLLIWSIATDPECQTKGLGRAMLEAADARARSLGRDRVRLYTGSLLGHLVAWYGRHGYAIERTEQLSDRAITHMMKQLDQG
jgi:GNAT superfamily N-acetyltransferase